MIIITQDEIESRIKTKFPNEPFKIIHYEKVSTPFTIQCLRCGKITTYSSTNNYLNTKRKGVCSCYNESNAVTRHDNNKILLIDLFSKHSYLDLQSFGYRSDIKKYTAKIHCNKCNSDFITSWQVALRHQKCPYCDEHHLLNKNVLANELGSEYTILDDYANYDSHIKVKHNCGFEWKTTPHKIMSKFYKGCPKCYPQKQSKGEQKISSCLERMLIPYEREKIFKWQNNKCRYDFYLPEQNCVIEYMGRQHFEETNFFKTSLEEQLIIDEEKRIIALKHNINYYRIDYTDFSNIEQILNCWFNDYPKREQE